MDDTDMDDTTLGRWGTHVAVFAAPDEQDLAADITLAYAAGGKARRDLFRGAGRAPGGIGGGLATVLPQLLDALAFAAREVEAASGSQQFANAVSAAALLVSLRRRRDADAGRAEPGTGPRTPPDAAAHAAFRLAARLRAHGLAEQDTERLACELLAGLLGASDPSGAAAEARPPRGVLGWLRRLFGPGTARPGAGGGPSGPRTGGGPSGPGGRG
ncbi:hypothetical protein [Kitasatospora sp. NPDC086791]|uniref:hypothetical protein n=1 Tax=Kitasatospora sp. NPDC086791 TaxID=3155178 RepID=UPI00341C3D3E